MSRSAKIRFKPKNADTRERFLLILAAFVSFSLACSISVDLFGNEEAGADTEPNVTVITQDQAEAVRTTTPPSDTPQPSVTATVIPTQTQSPTPDAILVSVTGNTYCRRGPGSIYDEQSILHTDQQSEIVARDPPGEFWLIINPDNESQTCWIWGRYATPQGSTSALPVFTPPPTPTPVLDFSPSYTVFIAQNNEEEWFGFSIRNMTPYSWESIKITVHSKYMDAGGNIKDQTSEITYNGFGDAGNPNDPTHTDTAEPGNLYFTYSEFQNPMYGESATIVMTICTKDNLQGICGTKTIIAHLD